MTDTDHRVGAVRAELALVGVAFVWGATFVLVKEALDDVSPLLFLAIRFTLAGLVLAFAYRRRLSAGPRQGSWWKGGTLAGACLICAYAFQTFGLRLTTPSKSAFLTGMAIVMVPLLSSVVYRSAPRSSEWVGVAVALVGMALMTLQQNDRGVNPGDLLTLAGSLFFSAHILVLGYFAPRDGFERLSVLQIVTAATLAWSTFWWIEESYIRWTPTVLVALGITGLLATAAAFTIQAWAQQRTSPTRTALIFALEPVFAAATSFVVLGEVLAGRATVGAVMILGGVLFVELKPFDRRGHLRHQSKPAAKRIPTTDH